MSPHLVWPEIHDDADSNLRGEGTADMEEIERAIGATGCRLGEQVR